MSGEAGARLAVGTLNFSKFDGNSHLLGKTYTIEEIFRAAKKMRVSGVEVSKIRTMRTDELLYASRMYKVPTVGASDGITVYGGSRNVTEFGELCRRVKELGGQFVSNLVDDSHSIDGAIAEIRARKSAAEGLGLKYFLETHRLSVTEDPEVARTISDAIPDLQFNADLSHWLVQGYSPKEFSWIFPRVGHVHARAASTDNVQVEVADGRSPEVNEYFESCIRPILTQGFHGTITVEIIPQLLSNQRYYPVDDTYNMLRELRSRFADSIVA